MLNHFFRRHAGRLLCAAVLAMTACTPALDWRDFHPADNGYTVLMPAKPTSAERQVTLNGIPLTMTMNAVELKGVLYAVGSVRVADASLAMPTLTAMKNALLKNINASMQTEKTSVSPADRSLNIQVEAIGAPAGGASGKPRALFGRFVTKDVRLFQVLVVGPQDVVTNEAVETFLSSFKVN